MHILSVSLINKFGPYPGGTPEVAVRIAYGDARQHRSSGVAWLVGSILQMVEAEVASVTHFELIGDRGLLRRPDQEPGTIPITPALVGSPIFSVMETVGGQLGGYLVRLDTSGESSFVGLGMEWPDRTEMLVSNLGPDAGPFPWMALAHPRIGSIS